MLEQLGVRGRTFEDRSFRGKIAKKRDEPAERLKRLLAGCNNRPVDVIGTVAR